MFKNYLTIALRNIVHHKTFSFINIAGLTLRMAFSLIFLGASNQISSSEINKTYPPKESIQLKSILGNCKVVKSDDENIHIKLTYSFSDEEYKANFSEDENKFLLEEEFSVKSPKGVALWMIKLPEGTKMEFSSGTGNFALEGVSSELKVNTGTGLIEVKKSTGKYELSTGTGNVNVLDVSIASKSKISSGTGNVNITLGTGSEYDLSIISGMGDAILKYNGNPLKGCFEFTVKKDSGRIVSPIQCEKEETFTDEHFTYDKKTFRIESRNIPLIQIEAGFGMAKLIR